MKITIPNAIQLQASAVSCKRRRRFWANLVPDIRFSSLAWVSGLLALLVVAVSPASAQDDPSLVILSQKGNPIGTTGNPLVLREEEEMVMFTVNLATEPTEAVNVMLDIIGAEGVRLSPSPLEFSTTKDAADGWNIPHVVTVTVVDDDIAQGTRNAEITYAVSGGDYQDLEIPATQVIVTDDDTASTRITVSADRFFGEEGESVPVEMTAVLNAAARIEDTDVPLSIVGTGEGGD